MTEPKYDEDAVNLGYLKKVLNNEGTDNSTGTISKHYASKPSTPYYAGDTWQDGYTVYTCIKTRLIGLYNQDDWTTESGAKEKAENKNKTYLTQPSDYNPGDMWILQSDDDHRAGRKGEILISTAGRNEYDPDDWVNMLGYGTIRSINEVANNINDALKRLNITKNEGKTIIFYTSTIPGSAKEDDLWYVTETADIYNKGSVYKYSEDEWKIIEDSLVVAAFEEANEPRLVEDGMIQAFYLVEMPIEGMAVGDIWIDTGTQKLYRYNGTNWVTVYDTNISEIRENVETVTKRVTSVETDLGEVTSKVSETTSHINTINNNLTELNESTASTGLRLNEFEIKFEEKTKTIDEDLQENIQTVKQMSYLFNTDDLKIAKEDDPVNARINNTGMRIYSYSELKAIFNHNGTGIQKLIVVGSAQLGNLQVIKGVDENGQACTDFHHLVSNIQELTDLEVQNG